MSALFSLLANPWLLLGAVAVVLGAFGAGYEANDDAERVQAAWDKANAVAFTARQARIDGVRAVQQKLQDAADEARRKTDAENKKRDARLAAALGELRDRPPRPGPGPGGLPAPAAVGPEGGGCTGAGLYRDDAELLTRKSDLAQRIRNQRDACYERYDAAREALEKLRPGP